MPDLADFHPALSGVVAQGGVADTFGTSVDDPFGTSSSEGVSQPIRRSEWLRGVVNGDFATSPFDATKAINSNADDADYNPLPGWTVVQTVSTGMALWWVADASVGSGGHAEVRLDANASGTLELYQDVPMRSSLSRNVAIAAVFTALASINPGSGNHKLILIVDEYDVNGALLTAGLVDTTSAGGRNNATLYTAVKDCLQTSAQSLNGATSYVRFRLQVTVVTPISSAVTYSFYETFCQPFPPIVGIPDLTTPGNAPAYFNKSNGSLQLNQATQLDLLGLPLVDVGMFQTDGSWLFDDNFTPSGTTLAADVNDYDIWTATGFTWDNAFCIPVKATGADRSITGFDASIPTLNGLVIGIHCPVASAFGLIFPHASALSAAANRFELPRSRDLYLRPGETAFFRHDNTTGSRWRVVWLSGVVTHTHASASEGGVVSGAAGSNARPFAFFAS